MLLQPRGRHIFWHLYAGSMLLCCARLYQHFKVTWVFGSPSNPTKSVFVCFDDCWRPVCVTRVLWEPSLTPSPPHGVEQLWPLAFTIQSWIVLEVWSGMLRPRPPAEWLFHQAVQPRRDFIQQFWANWIVRYYSLVVIFSVIFKNFRHLERSLAYPTPSPHISAAELIFPVSVQITLSHPSNKWSNCIFSSYQLILVRRWQMWWGSPVNPGCCCCWGGCLTDVVSLEPVWKKVSLQFLGNNIMF